MTVVRRPRTFPRLFVLTIFFCLVHNVDAQEFDALDVQTIPDQSGGLASSDAIPVEFLLFHRDPRIQALVNPSRAAHLDRGFRAVSYDRQPRQTLFDLGPNLDFGRQVSFTTISNNRRLLFSILASAATGTSDFRNAQLVEGPNTTQTLESVSEGNNRRDRFNIRVVKIRQPVDGVAKSFGLTVGFSETFNKNQSTSIDDVRNNLLSPTGRRAIDTRSRRNELATETNRFLSAMIERSRSTLHTDWITTASFVRNIRGNLVESTLTSDQSDSLFVGLTTRVQLEEFNETNMDNVDNDRNVAAIGTYVRRQSKSSKRSFFITAQGTVGWGTAKTATSDARRETNSEYLNGTLQDRETSAQSDELNLDNNGFSWKGRVGFGLVQSGTFESLSFNAGLSADLVASRIENLDVRANASQTLETTTTDIRLGQVTTPAIAYYEVVEGLNIFGGIVHVMRFQYQTTDTIELNEPTDDTNSFSSQQSASTSRTLFTSDASYPLGIELSHPSGFFLQGAFRGSLTEYNSWRVSVGIDLD